MAQNALMNMLQAASNSAASNVSAPVDGIAWLLRKAGIPVPENAVGGSDWMAQRGLMAPVQQGAGQVAGETLGLLAGPVAALKAPQIAGGLLAAERNLAAPAVVNRGGAAGQRGIFMGDLSKTWNKEAAEKAKAMEKAGKDARTIWQETGTFKGADGKWRQEIDDSGALFNPSTINGKMQENDIFNAVPGMSVGRGSDLLHHPGLTEAYGRDLVPKTYIGNKNTLFGDGVQGSYDEAAGALTINAPAKAAEARSTTLHELQHAVQGRQGFAKGGSPGDGSMAPFVYGGAADKRMKEMEPLFDSVPYLSPQYDALTREFAALRKQSEAEAAFEGYRRLAGEAEARAVQSRMGLSAAERRAKFPFDSYDVPVNSLIVR